MSACPKITSEQEKAVSSVKRALSKAHSAGLTLFVGDGSVFLPPDGFDFMRSGSDINEINHAFLVQTEIHADGGAGT